MTPARAAGVGVRLPRGVVHTDERCHHTRGKAVGAPLLDPAPGDVCRDCRKRLERQRIRERRERAATAVAQAQADVATRPGWVEDQVIALSRRSVG